MEKMSNTDRETVIRIISGDATKSELQGIQRRIDQDSELRSEVKQFYDAQNIVEDVIASAVVIRQMQSQAVEVCQEQEDIKPSNVVQGTFPLFKVRVAASIVAIFLFVFLGKLFFDSQDRINFGPKLAIAARARGIEQMEPEAIQFAFSLKDDWEEGQATIVNSDGVRLESALLSEAGEGNNILRYKLDSVGKATTGETLGFKGQLEVQLLMEVDQANDVGDIRDVELSGQFSSGESIRVSWKRDE